MSNSLTVPSNAGAYRRHLTLRQQEAEVFGRVTAQLRGLPAAEPIARARAISDNRRLWEAVRDAVKDPANALPLTLRSDLASVATTVLRQCTAAEPDIGFLIEINEHIAAGLWS